MSDELKCAHGIKGGVNVVVECNQRLKTQIDDALNVLRSTCSWRKGDGFYVSECVDSEGDRYCHDSSDDPEEWKFCPYCSNRIPQPLLAVEIDPHG